MVSCFSSSSASAPPPPTAKVVSINGDLRECAPLVSVRQVLTTSSADYFLCNSDLLSYGEPIPALASDVFLIPNQLYFLLLISKLNSNLTIEELVMDMLSPDVPLGGLEEHRLVEAAPDVPGSVDQHWNW
ncbi:hypothetical protein LINGRAHAP2_LOCUS22473 [Linum grandiflorum]